MPTHQQITAAREKAKRIRECANQFRHEQLLERIAKEEFGALAQLDTLDVHEPEDFPVKGKKEVSRLVGSESRVGRAA